MGKWFGKIGFATREQTSPGVWMDDIVEKEYYGDLVRNTNSRYVSSGNVNDNVTISNAISILADPFAYKHFSTIRYIMFMDTKWKVDSIEVQYPRLVVTLGGVWNE